MNGSTMEQSFRVGNSSGMDVATSVWKHPFVFALRRMFVLVSPHETSFSKVGDVPDYVAQAFPFFFAFIFLEMILQRMCNTPATRLNDAISSLCAGLCSLLPGLVFRSAELWGYIWLWQRYCLYELPWDNPLTWFLSFLGVDFGYYWFHRMGHEINCLWAAHQTHHSSEDYNLTTALRQSMFQKYTSWIFYLPLAFFVPPPIFMVHSQFNLLYQFWIHTEVVGRLGPLEYILCTPSHHRVHHGRNRYCIDKNYGGTLIIWDRLFGTFEAENEQVVYGLTHALNSWDQVNIQLCHGLHILRTAWASQGLANKLSVFFQGPGWEPGKPRLGLPEDIPDVHAPHPKYDVSVPGWFHGYTITHLALATLGHLALTTIPNLHVTMVIYGALFLLWTLIDIGYLYEHRWYASWLELLRCLMYIVVDIAGAFLALDLPINLNYLYIPRTLFLGSLSIWIVHFAKGMGQKQFKED